MTTEFERMRQGEVYDFMDPEIHASLTHARKACAAFRKLDTLHSAEYRAALLDLIPGCPESSMVSPPFLCEHGNGIRMGEDVFVNYGCVFLDQAPITLGDWVKIGPNCQLYTVNHPVNYLERRKTIEKARPITIGEDTWLGGGVIVCPGVTIGKRCIIAAGSVVTRDIPDDSLAAGNPAVVKKTIPRE